MNALNREIKHGEIVIIAKEYIREEFHADRRFRVLGGFGMQSFTSGTALSGEFLVDGERCRMEGNMIDAEETRQFQAQANVGQ